MTDVYAKDGAIAPRRRRAQLNWLLTVLPAFPLVLLVLRLWYLSRQDLPTMLLLVQYISPLGMISALFITLIWTVPAVILVLRVLGGILLVSAPERRRPLAARGDRAADAGLGGAGGRGAGRLHLAAAPAAGAAACWSSSILGLTAVQRFRGERWLLLWITLGVPIAGRACWS